LSLFRTTRFHRKFSVIASYAPTAEQMPAVTPLSSPITITGLLGGTFTYLRNLGW
jgi:hypothetical protein